MDSKREEMRARKMKEMRMIIEIMNENKIINGYIIGGEDITIQTRSGLMIDLKIMV